MKLRIMHKILILVFLITAFSGSIFLYLSLQLAQRAEIKRINDVLRATAYGTRNIVGDDYHDRITGADSLTEEEYEKYAFRLTNFAKSVNAFYVYSYIEKKDNPTDEFGRMFFTASSISDKELESGKIEPFFTEYTDTKMIKTILFVPLRDNKIHYDEYEDEYGHFRSVFIPFTTPSGKKYCIGADFDITYVKQRLANVRNIYILIGLGIFLVAFLIAYFIVFRISKPLQKLASYTNELVDNDFVLSDGSSQSLETISRKSKDEVGALSQSFLLMQRSLIQYIRDLKETTALKERIESELKVASDLQISMLPRELQISPGKDSFSIFTFMRPAKEVGGDLYNFFFTEDHKLYFVIGDVSGKSVPAALFMAMTNTLIKAMTIGGFPPAKVVEETNRELCQNNDSSMFVTLFLGLYDTKTGLVRFVNAGHNPPLLVNSKKEAVYLQPNRGVALGVTEDIPFIEEELQLQPGEMLVMYTDGVTEANNATMELFGTDRLQEFLNGFSGSAKEVIDELLLKIDAFAAGTEQADDITLVTLKRIR